MLSAIFLPAAFGPFRRTADSRTASSGGIALIVSGLAVLIAGRGRHAVAQLVRALQVDRAPRAGLGLVAQLLVGVGQQSLASALSGFANTTCFITSATQR